MYLFFDAVSTRGYIWLFNSDKILQAEYFFAASGNEGKELPGLIDMFLKQQSVSYTEIQNIVCVVGPGSFTGIRMVSLVVNTLAYIYPHLTLTPISFFDLYTQYPIINTSSKKDLFVKWEKHATIEVVGKGDFEAHMRSLPHAPKYCYGNASWGLWERTFFLEEQYVPSEVLQRTQIQTLKKLAPLYVKKPNIS